MPTSSRAGVSFFMGGLNGETLCFHPISLFCSTYQVGSVRLRDDVGIVPYIHVGLRSVQRIAAPYQSALRTASFHWGCEFAPAFPKEPLNKSASAGRRIFCPIRAVLKAGNTYSIPPLSELSAETKSSAASSCRFNQSFPNAILPTVT